jgi:hypothetical protein
VDDALITQDKITQEEYKIKLDAQKQKNNVKLASLKKVSGTT